MSKIGGDIVCLFIGVKGTITAVTKAGKLIKIGRTTSGMGKVISVSMKSGFVTTAVEGSSVLEVEAAPQMIIESVQEASKALGILKTTLMQAGKVAGSGVVAGAVTGGGGGFSLAHDIGSTSSTAPQSSTSGGSSELRETIKVNNMNELFERTDFGRTLKPKSRKTPYIQDRCPIYEITEKVSNPHLGKGDLYYLDYSHRDHLEVFTHQGKAKCVLNLDGTVNEAKTAEALSKGRTIKI